MKTFALPFLVSCLALALPLANAGCAGYGCTEEARSSVSVFVRDAADKPIADAEVTFSVDGGPAQPCENQEDGVYICGQEVSGLFVITAKRGSATKSTTVEVEADSCHVKSTSTLIKL